MFGVTGPKCGKIDIPIKIGMRINMIGMAASIIPRYKQFFAFFGSSSFMTKYAMIPPITLKIIGNKNQRLLRRLICIIIIYNSFHLKKILQF
jgi:hypothetical protein